MGFEFCQREAARHSLARSACASLIRGMPHHQAIRFKHTRHRFREMVLGDTLLIIHADFRRCEVRGFQHGVLDVSAREDETLRRNSDN